METPVEFTNIPEKYVSIDIARAVATFMIVCFHSMLCYTANGGHPVMGAPAHQIVGGLFLWGRVPFFFMLCGFLASKSLSKPEATPGHFIMTRVKGLGIPYLFWNLLTLCMHVAAQISGVTQKHSMTDSPGSMIGSVLGVGLSPADTPMWFVRDLILAHCLAPFLFKARRWLFVPSLLLLALPITSHEMPNLSSFGYYMIGMLLYDINLRKFESLLPSAAAGVLLCMGLGLATVFHGGVNLGVMGPLLGAGAILLLGMAINEISPRAATLLSSLSSSSFMIYAANFPILIAIQMLQDRYWNMGNTPMLLFYSLLPFVITLGIFGCHVIIQRKFPQLLLFLTGGR